MSHKSIQLAAAIVNRGAGNRAASIFHTYNHEILLAVRGHGTASSAVMDCLGLDEPEKDLVLGLSSRPARPSAPCPWQGNGILQARTRHCFYPFPHRH